MKYVNKKYLLEIDCPYCITCPWKYELYQCKFTSSCFLTVYMYSTYCTLVSLVPWHWSRGVWQLGRAWQGDRSGAETNSQEAGSQPAPHTVTICKWKRKLNFNDNNYGLLCNNCKNLVRLSKYRVRFRGVHGTSESNSAVFMTLRSAWQYRALLHGVQKRWRVRLRGEQDTAESDSVVSKKRLSQTLWCAI